MKYFVVIFCISLVACQGVEHTIPAQIRQAEEARKQSDSLLQEFKRVNESLKASTHSIHSTNDSALKRLDSLTKSMGAAAEPSINN